MCVIYSQTAFDQYRRSGTDLFQFRCLAEQFQYVALLKSKNSGDPQCWQPMKAACRKKLILLPLRRDPCIYTAFRSTPLRHSVSCRWFHTFASCRARTHVGIPILLWHLAESFSSGVVPPLFLFLLYPHSPTVLYSDIGRFNRHSVTCLSLGAAFHTNPLCVRCRPTSWYHALLPTVYNYQKQIYITWFIFLSLVLKVLWTARSYTKLHNAIEMLIRITIARARRMTIVHYSNLYRYIWCLSAMVSLFFVHAFEYLFPTLYRNIIARLSHQWKFSMQRYSYFYHPFHPYTANNQYEDISIFKTKGLLERHFAANLTRLRKSRGFVVVSVQQKFHIIMVDVLPKLRNMLSDNYGIADDFDQITANEVDIFKNVAFQFWDRKDEPRFRDDFLSAEPFVSDS